MSFTTELRKFVLQQSAVNNPYLDRFRQGEVDDEEFHHFAVQFFAFVKHFPRILAGAESAEGSSRKRSLVLSATCL